MELTSFTELRNTREKLKWLEQFYEEQSVAPAANAYVRELSQKSIRKMILQLKEEIARFEAKVTRPEAEVERPATIAPLHQTDAG